MSAQSPCTGPQSAPLRHSRDICAPVHPWGQSIVAVAPCSVAANTKSAAHCGRCVGDVVGSSDGCSVGAPVGSDVGLAVGVQSPAVSE